MQSYISWINPSANLIGFILFVPSFIILLLTINLYLPRSSRRLDLEKLSPYECGMNPLGDARQKFRIHYILVGILFIVFDLEVILLFPYATVLYETSLLGF